MAASVALIIVLFSTFVIGYFFKRLGLPQVIAQILTGVLLTLPFAAPLLNSGDKVLLKNMAEIGIIFILFYVGMEVDLLSLFRKSKEGIEIAVSSSIVPFILGLVGMLLLGKSPLIALIVGLSVTVNAIAVSADILEELKLLKSKLGHILISAATFDDVFDFVFLSIIIAIASAATTKLSPVFGFVSFVKDLSLFLVIVIVSYKFVMPAIYHILEKQKDETEIFVFSFLLAIFFAFFSEALQLGVAIGALFAGALMRHLILDDVEEKKSRKIYKGFVDIVRVITFGLLGPIFFVGVGMNFDLSGLSSYLGLAVFITILGTAGNLVGAMSGAAMAKLDSKYGFTLGWGMNVRGEVELIGAEIARKVGLVDPGIFSAIIIMTLITTLISPIIFKFLCQAWFKDIRGLTYEGGVHHNHIGGGQIQIPAQENYKEKSFEEMRF